MIRGPKTYGTRGKTIGLSKLGKEWFGKEPLDKTDGHLRRM